jgi:superfamily I DNA/RNA helicase
MLEESQHAVLASEGSLSVLGAPGSGRTTTLVELAATSVESGLAPDEVLVLGANRRAADALRERLTRRLGRATRGATLGRTPVSVAMEIIADVRTRTGGARPVLLTGSAQDDILADLIEGYLDGTMARLGRELPWPDWFHGESMRLAGFRSELRDLITALTERGLGADDLARLALPPNDLPPAGQRHRALWAAAAQLIRDYENSRFDRTISGPDEREAFDVASALARARRLVAERAPGRRGVRVFDTVRLVLVDDAQELTESARALVAELERTGARVVTFGDPDVATGRFHGGEARFAVNWRDAGDAAPPTHTLEAVHRHGPELRAVVRAATNGLPALGPSQRRLAEASDGDSERSAAESEDASGAGSGAEVEPAAQHAVLDSAGDEAELIAGYLRRLHLVDGVPWADMAVIARNAGRLEQLSRGFDRAGVAATDSAPIAAASDATVRALLTITEGALRGELSADELEAVLASPLYRVDSLLLRRLRRACYLADFSSADGTAVAGRGGREVLVAHVRAVLAGGEDPTVVEALNTLQGTAAERAAEQLRALLAALTRTRAAHERGDTIDAVFYEAWHDDARERRWREVALSGGDEATPMNRRLDAVVALFDRARRIVEREPTVSLESFLADWRRDSVVDDSLARRGTVDAVTLTTPAGAVSREWRVVVVAGMNDGVWPNLRVRDTLLGAGRLDEALLPGRVVAALDRRAEVLADEQRMLTAAVSRATERLLVTAVRDDETMPSQFVHRLDLPELKATFALGEAGGVTYRELSLGQLAARLRRGWADDDETGRGERARALARLAGHDVAAADPTKWFGVRGRTTTAPLVPITDGVLSLRLSPSGIAKFKECGVNWFVEGHAGGTGSFAMTLGNVLHAAAEHEAEFSRLEEMVDYAERLLEGVTFDAPWLAEVNRTIVRDAAASLWDYVRREGVRAVANERAMEHELRRSGDIEVEVTLSGRIDRIESHADDGVRIVDFKTGKFKVPKYAENDQLRAYQVAALGGGIEGYDPEHEYLEGAALVYPRISSGRPNARVPWAADVQPRLDDATLADVIDEFVTIAIQQAGYGLDGDAPDVDAPAAFLHDPEGHCLENGSPCLIHALPEVTE